MGYSTNHDNGITNIIRNNRYNISSGNSNLRKGPKFLNGIVRNIINIIMCEKNNNPGISTTTVNGDINERATNKETKEKETQTL